MCKVHLRFNVHLYFEGNCTSLHRSFIRKQERFKMMYQVRVWAKTVPEHKVSGHDVNDIHYRNTDLYCEKKTS